MQIIKEELVDGVSLTGSVEAGLEIGELAEKNYQAFRAGTRRLGPLHSA
jgi:acyl-CoA reductase-like NAD-dependent aldehyde dehydrogenase